MEESIIGTAIVSFFVGMAAEYVKRKLTAKKKERRPRLRLVRGMGPEVEPGSVLDSGPFADPGGTRVVVKCPCGATTNPDETGGVCIECGSELVRVPAEDVTMPSERLTAYERDVIESMPMEPVVFTVGESPWKSDYVPLYNGDLDPKLPPSPEKRVRVAAWLATMLRDQYMFGTQSLSNAESIRMILVVPDSEWAANIAALNMAIVDPPVYDPVDGKERFTQSLALKTKVPAPTPYS